MAFKRVHVEIYGVRSVVPYNWASPPRLTAWARCLYNIYGTAAEHWRELETAEHAASNIQLDMPSSKC